MNNPEYNVFEINLGDWSNDGHGRTSEYRVIIPAEFTLEMIADNYKSNCQKYGTTLETECEEQEDRSFSAEPLQKMVEDGLHGGIMEEYDPEEDITVQIDEEDFFKISCHMLFHGMPDNFTWKELKPQGILVGGHRAIVNTAGYGFFY